MRFSEKQRRVLNWWRDGQDGERLEAIICDGAVRSGKTMCMTLSFFLWAMACFRGESFALCGKTVSAVRRNMLTSVVRHLRALGFLVTQRISVNMITVRRGRRENTFYLFGGKDESSAAHIQGLTLAGVLLDEVALMPRSFVEQALARCSVQGSRFWFSCNPEGPEHWFYREWICQAQERRALYLHFTMEDNPGLSPAVRARYERTFQGAFYRRFVLGEWAACEGRVYDFFDRSRMPPAPAGPFEKWAISCDYGTANPASFGLWGKLGDAWYRVKEYYYDSRREGRQKTDGEYADDLAALAGEREIAWVVVDPSAASFIELLRRRGWRVFKADNDVLGGIRRTAALLQEGKLVICQGCEAAAREFALYRWEEGASQDRVRKENDHAMDDIRYFAAAAFRTQRWGMGAVAVERTVI